MSLREPVQVHDILRELDSYCNNIMLRILSSLAAAILLNAALNIFRCAELDKGLRWTPGAGKRLVAGRCDVTSTHPERPVCGSCDAAMTDCESKQYGFRACHIKHSAASTPCALSHKRSPALGSAIDFPLRVHGKTLVVLSTAVASLREGLTAYWCVQVSTWLA